MRILFWNVMAVLAAATLVLGYETGTLSAANAFFFAVVVLTGVTGYQLMLREELPFRDAVMSLIAKPRSYGTRLGMLAYGATIALGTVVLLQTVSLL